MANKKKNSGKKTTRNTTKKSNKKVVEETSFDASLGSTIRLVIIIGVIFGLFYLITWFITKKPEEKEDDTYKSGFSYTEIMAGRSFSMSDGEYLVLYYDSTDEDINDIYSSLPSKYRSKEGAVSIYTVNMGEGLNKGMIAEESNTHPNNASELAINGPTLIRFNNHEVVDYYEGEESIKSVLE